DLCDGVVLTADEPDAGGAGLPQRPALYHHGALLCRAAPRRRGSGARTPAAVPPERQRPVVPPGRLGRGRHSPLPAGATDRGGPERGGGHPLSHRRLPAGGGAERGFSLVAGPGAPDPSSRRGPPRHRLLGGGVRPPRSGAESPPSVLSPIFP